MGVRAISMCGVVLALASVSACGGGSSGDNGDDDMRDDARPSIDAATTDGAIQDAPLLDGPPVDGAVTSVMVGSGGGTLTTPDGVVLVIPPGALAADTTITIAYASDGVGSGAVSNVYELSPDGTQFTVPVALTVPYHPSRLVGLPEGELALASWTTNGYTSAGWTLIDGARDTATSYITHFSQWAVIPSPASAGCTVNQNCFRTCSGSQPPNMCCARFGTTCRARLTTSFPRFVNCYSQCVGTPQAANFHNSACMAGCCSGQGWTVMRQGACYKASASQAEAQQVLDCARGCFGGSDSTSLCGNQPIIFHPCSWQVTMMPVTMGNQCTPEVGDGLSAQLLATELGPVLAQTWGNPALVSITGGSFDATSISIPLACANGEPGSGAMDGTWNGQMFTGTWTLGTDSGNFTIAPDF